MMTANEKTPLLLPSKSVSDRMYAAADVNEATLKKESWLRRISRRKTRRGLRQFYEYQTNLIGCYDKDSKAVDCNDVDGDAKIAADAEVARKRRIDKILAKLTFSLNITFLLANATASYLSHSLSVISTVIDSAMDITSGVVVYITLRAIQNSNPYQYPRGRTRLEPLAVVIVSILMGVANLMMIIQSVESVINNTVDPVVDIATFSILCSSILIKAVLFVFCYRQKTTSSMVLAMDQRNDIATSLVALAGALIGDRLWLYADPLGAILVCSIIAGNWFYTAFGQIPILSGKAASPEFINRIIRVAITHDDRIKCLDTVMVYHYGNDFLVELHVVLDPNTTLKEAHDVSEPLQIKLERLPYVERAFVHCDYHCDGVK